MSAFLPRLARTGALILWATFGSTLPRACDLPACQCKDAGTTAHSRQGAWRIAETANFQVCSLASSTEAGQVARSCEELRAAIVEAWGLPSAGDAWTPKCQVILHGNVRAYGAAVGAEHASTFGSSLVEPFTGSIRARRIDLRTDVANYLHEALPHELTHVLLADSYRDGPAPLWFDEGIALLADTRAKQLLHERDLHEGLRSRTEYSLNALLTATAYPPNDRMGVFYGQCASLARFLRARGTPGELWQFASRVRDLGANLALRECYGIQGVADLERQWRQSLHNPSRDAVAPILLVNSQEPLVLLDRVGE